ncbi:XRE family transcriptional regulator [Euzebyella marina]|uniref:XRE family transcriptional regulator n=2 Tax=Euzebyella marina TaxID=1761453 RepID=A0A3G2L1U1_9FLAO|nr:XRE family transcriptional regulator [Euzebyella marina]
MLTDLTLPYAQILKWSYYLVKNNGRLKRKKASLRLLLIMNANNLKEIFDKSELTQKEFADKIGKSVRTFQNYLSGETSPTSKVVEDIIAIANELNIDFDGTNKKGLDNLSDFSDLEITEYIAQNLGRFKALATFRKVVGLKD